MHKILAHAQHSYACTTNTLVHAQPSCACTTNTLVHAQEPGLGPKKGAGPVPGPGPRPFWVPALGTGPSSACTRVFVVHAQESCACTRILYMHKNLDILYDFLNFCTYTLLFLHNNKCCSETFPYQRSDFLVHLHLHNRLRRIRWRIVNSCREHE